MYVFSAKPNAIAPKGLEDSARGFQPWVEWREDKVRIGMILLTPREGARNSASVSTLIMLYPYRPEDPEWLARPVFQNCCPFRNPDTGWKPDAALACRRGCRWSADLPAGAFETSFHTPGS